MKRLPDFINKTLRLILFSIKNVNIWLNSVSNAKAVNKMGNDIPALIKSPCNGQAKSPSQSPSPRVDSTVVKEPYNNMFFAKRDFGKSMNNYMWM